MRRVLLLLVYLLLCFPVFASLAAAAGIVLAEPVASVEKPTHITHAGDRSNRLFIAEQQGRIIIVKQGIRLKTPFLDIRSRVGCCGERGLLSIAFPPGYGKKQYFYAHYTDRSGDTVVSRFRTSPDPDTADPSSEEIVLQAKQPFSNHNGGQLAFGPDGYLYIGLGDGGAANDPFDNGQKMTTFLGKVLRIDVENGKRPYAVPPSNPFVGKKNALPEIWSLGLRNPWRFSFDRLTGELFIADVGQNKYEEVNVQPAESAGGENYGWNIMEGTHCFGSRTCDRTGLVLPAVEYGHDQGCSVTGGMVYRGIAIPSLVGTYLYGDFCSGRIWGMRRSGSSRISTLLMDSELSISTFGDDEQGELYVADHSSDGIYRITAAGDTDEQRTDGK